MVCFPVQMKDGGGCGAAFYTSSVQSRYIIMWDCVLPLVVFILYLVTVSARFCILHILWKSNSFMTYKQHNISFST